MHTNSVRCRLLADLMHTNFVLLCRILADLMHTNSVLCRLFADSMHTLRRTNQCQSKCRSTCGGGPSALSSRQRWRCYGLRGEAAFFAGEAAAAAAPRAGEAAAAAAPRAGEGVACRDAGSGREGLAGEPLAAAAALRAGEGGARGGEERSAEDPRPPAAFGAPCILAIRSSAPDLEVVLRPIAGFAAALVICSNQMASKSSMFSLCCFSENARNDSRVWASTLVL